MTLSEKQLDLNYERSAQDTPMSSVLCNCILLTTALSRVSFAWSLPMYLQLKYAGSALS